MERMTRTNSLAFRQSDSAGLSYTGTREKYCLHHEKSCDDYGSHRRCSFSLCDVPAAALGWRQSSNDADGDCWLWDPSHVLNTPGYILTQFQEMISTERASSYWLNGWKPEIHVNDFQISVFTSQETQRPHISRTSYLMLFRKTLTHCSENRENILDALGEQSVRFQNVHARGIYSNHRVLKGHYDCYVCFRRFPEISQQTQWFYVFNLKIF